MSKNKQPKTGVRFNLFDAILILAVLACIGGIVAHAYFISDLQQTRSENATIVFTVSGVSEKTADAFATVGSTVYNAADDRVLGTIEIAECTPHTLQIENTEGILTTVVHPDKMNVSGEACFTGTWTEDGFLIGGSLPAIVGKTLNVYTEHAVCTITIVSVYPQLQKK